MNNQSHKRIIKTANLELIPCELEYLEAIMRDKKELEQILSVTVPDNWPQMPESLDYVYKALHADPASPEWGYHLFVHTKDRALIGEGGYKGRPDAEGVVEIGYAIIPEYRRRGLASEAARGLTDKAFSHAEVAVVQAHTLKDGTASINVLKKLGMKFVGTAVDPDEGEVFQWQVERKDYLS
ncbi:MAG: [ribosomal protein S5]-alanine N-acetyltransferase [Acidobacteriota bacterium]|jgi:RimJ/RimL family protein N-acetyltransferase|nr:[ribosomal protein S5]-alanine N-acetyltransferase [Acidobacteriota bacterium]